MCGFFQSQSKTCYALSLIFLTGVSVLKQATKKGLTLEELERCYIIAARIVADYGDAYLPVFERMKYELEKAKKTEGLKALAIAVTKENRGH